MQLENKTTNIRLVLNEGGEAVYATYAELINLVMGVPVQGGYSIDDIRHRISIKDSAEKAKGQGEIEMSITDADYLKKLIKVTKFPFVHEDLLEFIDAIAAMRK